ncbi:mechanosensitive ion channel family protein [Algoriphagus formosus]|uniref:mechanosensitive ion channel family protein n=1 Tax=Algoriphagus formosus TaxID=2007308 RepID=UPI003F713789
MKPLRLLIFGVFVFLSFPLISNSQTIKKDVIDKITGISDSLKLETESEEVINLPKVAEEINQQEQQLSRLLPQLISKIKRYSIDISKTQLLLKEPLDTTEMTEIIPELDQAIRSMRGLIEDTVRQDNVRYLKGMSAILSGILSEIEKFEAVIDSRVDLVLTASENLNKIQSDSIIQYDTKKLEFAPEVFQEINYLKKQVFDLEKEIFKQELLLTRYQSQLNDLNNRVISTSQYFKQKSKELNRKIWKKEVNYLWEQKDETYGSPKSTPTIIKESFLSNGTFVLYFVNRNLTKFIFFFVILFVVGLYLRKTIKVIEKEKNFSQTILSKSKSIYNYPIISSFLIIIPLYFFVFDRTPLAFNSALSVIFTFLCSWVIKDFFPERFKRLWWIFLPLTLIGPVLGVTWEHNYGERFYYLVANILALLFGFLALSTIKEKDFKGKSILKVLLVLLIVTQVFSLGTNTLGRLSLAKLYGTTGITSFFRGVSLYIFTNLVMQFFYLTIESKKESDTISSYIDFRELEKRFSGILQVFAFSIWAYGILIHLGYFDTIYERVSDFLSEEYTLGETSFTFGTVLLFMIILLVSSFLSNSIAYFFSTFDQKNATSRKNRLGSSVLLIRLAVMTIGFFIALTAAKIPLDRITIVLGALSVGIGFGLQTIINNLVSGIILAFERPIQIGDEIEVGMNKGTVKEVGIRASKIQAYDGSEIVVPNGDLLSQSLINWTLSDKRRRVELIIGVAYDSDMKKVKEILTEVLNRDNILKLPQPRVFMQNFGESSVDFRLLFWVGSMDIWLEMRSEVMTSIFEAFQQNQIEIPFPKRDLYLKTVPSSWQEKVSPPIRENQEGNSESQA